jgi:MFS transporter, FHS family, glucose/mannose:H+ symporter
MTSVASRRLTLIVLCAIFLADGIVMAAIGPTLPDLARQTGRSLGEVGRVFVAVFGGSLLAQVLGGPISDRFGRRVVLVLGLLLFGLGTAGMVTSHRMLWLLSAAIVAGIGYGGCTLAVNVLASEIAPERRASTVNLVNLFYAMGAIAGPLIAGALLEARGSALATLGIGSALLLLLVPISLRGVSSDRDHRGAPETVEARPVGGSLDAATPFIAALGLLLALYVGSEASLGAWAPVYLQQSTPLDAAGATTATAAFWVALCGGRLLAAIAGVRISAERLLVLSLLGSAASGLLLVVGHGLASVSVVALAMLGLTFGPIYPTGVAIVTGRFAGAAGAATSRIGLVAALGGMALPWLQGVVLTHWGTRTSAWLTLGVLIAMTATWPVVRRADPRARHRATTR